LKNKNNLLLKECYNKNCKKIFIPKNIKQKFCSISCAAQINNIGINRHAKNSKLKTNNLCLNCNKPVKNKYCSIECQSNYIYKQYIEKWKQGLINGIRKPFKTSVFIHKYIREKYDNKCAKCGWCEINKTTGNIPVELDHIDGHWDNNKEENLTLLCPNCHSLTSTYGALNKGNGRPNR